MIIAIVILSLFTVTFYKQGKEITERNNSLNENSVKVQCTITQTDEYNTICEFEYNGFKFENMLIPNCPTERYQVGDTAEILITDYSEPAVEGDYPYIEIRHPDNPITTQILTFLPIIILSVMMLSIIISTIAMAIKCAPILSGEERCGIIDDIIVTSSVRSNKRLPCIYRIVSYDESGREIVLEQKGKFHEVTTYRGKYCTVYINPNNENKFYIDMFTKPAEDEVAHFQMRLPQYAEKKYSAGYSLGENYHKSGVGFAMIFVVIGLFIASVGVSEIFDAVNGGGEIADGLINGGAPILFGAIFAGAGIFVSVSTAKSKPKKNIKSENSLVIPTRIDNFVVRNQVINGKRYCEISLSCMSPTGQRLDVTNHPVLLENPDDLAIGDVVNVYFSGRDYKDYTIDIDECIARKQGTPAGNSFSFR